MTQPPKYGIALTVALGMFLAVLDATIVSVALIPISKAVHTTFDSIQWIFIGYLLANAAVEVLSGYLGNRLGTKPVYLLGMAVFTVASVLCGFAPDESWLIALRVVQGVGGGVLLPLGTAIAFESVSKSERAKVTAIVGVPLLLAPVVGPIIGGWIVDNLNWQAIFFVNLPLGLLAFGLTWWLLPADLMRSTEVHEKAKFDYVSLLLSTAGVIVLVYALKLVSQTNPDTVSSANPAGDVYGWSYGPVWLLLGVSAVLLISFAVVSLRKIDPVLDLRQFKRRNFTMSNLVNWLSTIVNYGVLALIPQFLQSIHTPNLSAIDTGFALVPTGLATLIGIVIAAGLYEKIGARWIVVSGAGLFALSFWQLSNLTPTVSTGDLWLWLFTLGLGVALTAMPVKTLALEDFSGEALNKASALVNASQLIFSSVGAAILVTLQVEQTITHSHQLSQSLPAGTTDPTVLTKLAAQAGTIALNDIFTVLAYCAIGLMVLSLGLPGKRKQNIAVEQVVPEAEVAESVA